MRHHVDGSLALCLVTALATHATAQLPNSNWMAARVLSGRSGTAMTFDATRGRTVLFGGASTASRFAETWEWDGTRWHLASPPQAPPARSDHAMAYDAARRRAVLFGGLSGSSTPANADTWTWDGVEWQRSLAPAPSQRFGHAMAYDEARQRVVLFGGANVPGALGDTWEWDGASWQQMFAVTSPSARSEHAMAYDAVRGSVLLFGGTNGAGETWEWSGSSWVQPSSTHGPATARARPPAPQGRRPLPRRAATASGDREPRVPARGTFTDRARRPVH